MIRSFSLIMATIVCMPLTAYANEDVDNASGDNETVETEYRLTGKTRMCIRELDIEWYTIVDSDTVLFRTGYGYFFNNVRGKCQLVKDAKLSFANYKSFNFCRNDGVSGCRLNVFQEAVVVNDSAE